MDRLRTLATGTRDIALYGSANLIKPAVGLAMIPLFTRLFEPSDYGVIGIYVVVVGLLTTVLSMNGPIFVLWNRAKLGPQKSAAAVGATVLLATVGGLLSLAIGAAWWLVAAPAEPFWLAIVGIGTAWATVWVLLSLHVHQADEEAWPYFMTSLALAVVGAGATLAFAIGLASDWTARVNGLAVAALIVGCWSAYSLQKRGMLQAGWGRTMVRPVLRFGLPLLPHTFGLWAAASLDRFIIAAVVGLASTGIYTVAVSIAAGFGAAHDGVSRFFAPRLARWIATGTVADERTAAQFAYSYSAAALATAPILIGVTIPIASWILPTEYQEVGTFLAWLIVAQAFIGIARIFTGYLYAAGWTGTLSGLTLVTAFVGAALAFAAVSLFGAIGAAIAAVAASAIRAIATHVIARRTGLLGSVFTTFRPNVTA